MGTPRVSSTGPRRVAPGRSGARPRAQTSQTSPPVLGYDLDDRAEPQSPHAALQPFGAYYVAAKTPPTLPEGKTLETFDQAQVRAIHDLYFSVGPGVTMPQFITRCKEHPAFAGRTRPFNEQNMVELFRAERGSFPWSWKTRTFVASSHALVERLLQAEKGTTYGQIIDALHREHGPAFSHGQALRSGARKLWAERPADYPFATKLPKKPDGTYTLEAMGEPSGIQYDTRGRLLATPKLGERVWEFVHDPRFLYHFRIQDFVQLVASEIPGFGLSHVQKLAEAGYAPNFEKARKFALERLCRQIHQLHVGEGMENLNDVLDALEKRFGHRRPDPSTVAFFRAHHPDLVPNFRAKKISDRLDVADELLKELLLHPEEPLRHIGDRLGLSRQRLVMVLHALRRYRPDELPVKSWHPWTAEDKAQLAKAVAECPLGTTQAELATILRTEYPDLMLRHDLSVPISISMTLRTQLDIPDWGALQAQRFREAFVRLAERSPKGTTIAELTRTLLERHPGTYHPDYVFELARRWKAKPEQYPPIAKLLDAAGKFPWEYARISRDQELAKVVGHIIRTNPGLTLRAYAKLVRDDAEIGPKVPGFSAEHIAGLRLAHPDHVPYVDDLKSEGHRAWLANRRKEHQVLAREAAKIANTHPDPESLNVNVLAKAMGVDYSKLRRAMEASPELFPWYRAVTRGPGPDLYLATRLAHEMEIAPVGTTLSQLVEDLRGDPSFREAYPDFSVNSFQWLRAQYPDLVPDWSTRNQILRSKLLVDELLAAPAGTSYKKVLLRLRKMHPGAFGPGFDRPEYVLRHWEGAPDRFPFAEVLKVKGQYKLVGRGKPSLIEKSRTNSDLATRLARLGALPESLPLVEAIADKMPKSAFSNVEVIAVQHLLDSQVPAFDVYARLGMAPGRTTVIGVPYSSSPIVGDALADRGFDVRIPPLDMARWFREVREVMWEKVAAAKESGRKILFIDDGGLAAQILSSDPELAKYAHMFTIVEQTRRGITVAEGVDLHSPLINVAQAPGKAIEGPMIGASSEERLIRRLTGLGINSVKGKKVGVVGYGVIGSAIAAMLGKAGAHVTILDTNHDTRAEAAKKFAVEEDRAAFFGAQDIILGSTGVNSITREDLAYLKDGVVLGSTSSKLVEIDVEAIEDASRKTPNGNPNLEVIDPDNFPPGVGYHLADGRTIKLLASGFPINFDRGPEDVPAEHIQLTRALMLIGALQAVGTKAAGFHALEPGRQLQAIDLFEALGVAEGHEGLLAAMGLARKKLVSVLEAQLPRKRKA